MERLRIPPHLGQNEQCRAQYSPSHDKFEKTSAVARHLGSFEAKTKTLHRQVSSGYNLKNMPLTELERSFTIEVTTASRA
jgi:hypothetical protein